MSSRRIRLRLSATKFRPCRLNNGKNRLRLTNGKKEGSQYAAKWMLVGRIGRRSLLPSG